MKLTFFGTRGYVEESSPAHAGHSAFTVEWKRRRLLCDFGENRRGMLASIRPDAIAVSHAHPDHSWGLKEGTDVPVYASEVTHAILKDLPIDRRVALPPGVARVVGPFSITLLPVAHSVRCPCTAIRIQAGKYTILYSGDIVAFPDPDKALAGVDVYVGDGSTPTGSLVRRHSSGDLIGHTTIRAQLGWLANAGVPRSIFSHFGKGPIEMGSAALRAKLEELGREKAPGCRIEIATDGAEFEI